MKKMKILKNLVVLKPFIILLVFNFIQLVLQAQDSTSSSSSTTTSVSTTQTTDWYTSPWVWVIGAAIFILLLVALLRGNSSRTAGSSDKVTVSKTVRRDTDTDV
jgi:hypothetical protein